MLPPSCWMSQRLSFVNTIRSDLISPTKQIIYKHDNFLSYYSHLGGRTLVLYLGLGDTVSLYCADCMAGIFYTTFCVSLATGDSG